MRSASRARWPTLSCSWTAAWWSSRAPRQRCSSTRATSAPGRSSRRFSEPEQLGRACVGAVPASGQIALQALDRLREVREGEAEANMPRLVIDGAGQQQHPGVLGDLLAPALDVEVATDPRESDRPGGRAHPLEQVLLTREESGRER